MLSVSPFMLLLLLSDRKLSRALTRNIQTLEPFDLLNSHINPVLVVVMVSDMLGQVNRQPQSACVSPNPRRIQSLVNTG